MRHAHATAKLGGYEPDTVVDAVVLDFENRRRRRGTVTAVRGTSFLVDLAETPALAHGDAYVLEDGGVVEIVAAPEELIEIRARDALHLMRLAWHLGNRHLETEISARWLRIRRDHVIADMLRGLGAKVLEIEAPFQPEGGAYSGEASGHGHHHERSHHAHDHQAHGHDHHGHDHHDHGRHGHDH